MIKHERIKSDIKRGLSEVFIRLGYSNVIFNRLILSSDFKYLNVEISSLNSETSDQLVVKLNKNIHNIVRDLHKHLHLRNFPKIRFSKDAHEKRIERINEIIKKFS